MMIECTSFVFSYIANVSYIFLYFLYCADVNALTTSSSSLICGFVYFTGFLLPF